MADNTLQQGTDTIATDDIGGIKWQRVKVGFGADGSASDVALTNPIPVGAGPAFTNASINTATAGDNTIVAAAGVGIKIYVVSLVLVCTAANVVTWKSGAATTLGGGMSFLANSGYDQNGSVLGPVVITAANQALVLNLGSAAQVSGNIVYYTGT